MKDITLSDVITLCRTKRTEITTALAVLEGMPGSDAVRIAAMCHQYATYGTILKAIGVTDETGRSIA